MKIFDLFLPDLVFYVGGVDVHADDRLGLLNISDEGIRKREALFFQAIVNHNRQMLQHQQHQQEKKQEKQQQPQDFPSAAVCCVVGGGYAWRIQDAVRRHAILFE